MKILHVLYSGLGGHGNVFFSMVNADLKKEFEYEALFNGIEDIREEYIERCCKNNISFSFIKKKAGRHLFFFYKIFKAVKKSDAHIIFIHGGVQLPPVWLAKITSFKKRSIIVRETQAIHLKSPREKLALEIAMKLADKVVFLSENYRLQTHQYLGKKYNDSIVCVIPNGIDLNTFCPLKNKSDGIVKLGMQSRIVSIKDHDTLIKAFALLQKKYPLQTFKLYIAGDGEGRPKLENKVLAAKLEGSIIFEGILAEKDLPAFLQKLDVYIHASFGETMSTSIMQAMACGKAIVASDVDGINNMIIDGVTGLLVKVKDSEHMANAIASLVFNNTLKSKLENAALETAKAKFNNSQMFLKYKNIFLQT
jgi:glycosyltransferase involved in cell wall biosynthesis